jgi:alkylation response protein AidB-like acyl-CoA dehydrogenase
MSTAFLANFSKAPPIFSREQFSPEHEEIRQMVREFATQEIFPKREELEKYNPELTLKILRQAGELGLVGAETPEAYGGLGMDKITGTIISENLATSRCASFVVTLGAQAGIGLLPIIYFGTEEQKQKYVTRIADTRLISAYCLTEAGAGSDALNIKTRAVLSEDGQAYILDGGKQFITNARFANVFILRQDRRQALHGIHCGPRYSRAHRGRGGEENGPQGFLHRQHYSGKSAGPPGEPSGRNREGSPDRFQYSEHRPL